ncbi:hypothetical protein D0838_04940 [Bordetella avium]|uniref:hypothetical protein n=1 Tax=Bordetella avium TaxID=521 RepID=UPI000E6839DB|nr:hypothetical protein [Bordetella avium]RIQ74548.1 hypothetical protein D0838_04940 [Bordetella avium]
MPSKKKDFPQTDDCHQPPPAQVASSANGQLSGNAGELKTDDQLGGLLASILNYGRWKYAEAKGLTEPDLSDVRAALDEVCEKVQALANRPAESTQPASNTYQLPSPAVSAEPVGWKICFTDRDGQYKTVLHGHNAVGDYRDIDPMASSIPLGPFAAPAASAEPVAWMTEDGLRVATDATKRSVMPRVAQDAFCVALVRRDAAPAADERTPVADERAAFEAKFPVPKLPQAWQLPLNLAIDAIENAAPVGQDWPVNWPLVLHGLKELRSALASAPAADGCRHVDTSETSTEPVAWMMAKRERNSDPKFTFADPSGVYQSVYLPLYAAPPAADERAPVGKVLPEWEQVSAKLECGETLTPLEVFVHYNEPAGDDADAWRDQLSAALASAPVVNPTLPLERALHGLISKICPGLDTGEILQDARWASAALSDIMANTPAADARDALISSIQSAVNEMKFDNFNATKRQMEFIKAGARRVIAEVNAAIAAQQGKGGE